MGEKEKKKKKKKKSTDASAYWVVREGAEQASQEWLVFCHLNKSMIQSLVHIEIQQLKYPVVQDAHLL